ncbi:DNA-binding GntR family transcriptional regulator [Lipingzhangella halophila]|uniref:DNA-binding GntR family transcriptional regulator n=1 Tax=Lipingzhangella halophila TaxID=1783352 RepID=A0A7W7RC53_9ACTN|nr:GntR family transcriptional regulator [Lipingzhangella halophila]MBB4929224.1 DNA-binding GntR family transcriptional regulator [Lipingzhangella halophila]
MQSTELAQDMLGRRIDRPVPLRERVYEAMQELIISGNLAPGQHLVESELAETLGVSRQPVREALQLLNSDGWVDLRPGYGAFVHAPTNQEVDQLLAVRSVLEGESARLAAQLADADGIARLNELCDEGEAAIAADDIDRIVAANAELHRYVTELSDNKVLLDFVSQVDRRVRWYYTPIARQRGMDSWREHRRLIDAIERGDSELASTIMREHTNRTRQSYLEQLQANPKDEAPAVPMRRRRRTAPRD